MTLLINILFLRMTDAHIKGEQIKSAKSYQRIDDSGKPGHLTKYKRNKVKLKEADKTPVNCTDDTDSESGAIDKFFAHDLPPFHKKSCSYQ